MSPRSSSAVLRPSSRRACPPPFLLKDFLEIVKSALAHGATADGSTVTLLDYLFSCVSPLRGREEGWQPHLPWWACSVMATTSRVSLSACLIKAKPVVAESPIAAEVAPDVATLPYHKSISHAYCCEFSVPCHCSQRTFAPDSAHRHQQRIIYAPKTIFAISSIWDTGLVPGVRLTTFVLLSVGTRYGQ